MTVLFSVVIPLYNRADVLAATLQSVFDQTCQDFEIVIVDDGSKDDPQTVVASIADPRIRLIRQDNAGGSAARNRGIDEARGRYIAFLDSDDRFLPDHLASLAESLEGADDKQIVFSPVIVDRGDGISFIKPPRAIGADESMADYLMRDRGFVQTSGLVVPAAMAKQVKYRLGLPFAQDTDFAIRLEQAGGRFRMTETPTAVWTDVVDPRRVSALRKGNLVAEWLEQMRPHISRKAYLGYRGWHVAKGIAPSAPLKAARYYSVAVANGCYGAKLCAVVLMQIVLPNHLYQRIANGVVARFGKSNGLAPSATVRS